MDKPCILRALSFQEGEIPCIFGVVLRPLLQGDLSGRGLQLPCGSAASWGQRLLLGSCGAGAPSTFLTMQGGVSVLLLSPAGFLQLCSVPRAVAQGF